MGSRRSGALVHRSWVVADMVLWPSVSQVWFLRGIAGMVLWWLEDEGLGVGGGSETARRGRLDRFLFTKEKGEEVLARVDWIDFCSLRKWGRK
jgi:hypothetical protein